MEVVSSAYRNKISGSGYLCSVCIANYNGEEFLADCIDSVLQQEGFPGTIEIIVHDDSSADNSVELIQTRFSEVKLIKSEENVGFCISNNRMVAAARGSFILLLNNDAILHKNALKTLYEASLEYGDGIFGLPQYDAENKQLIDIGSTFDPFLNPIPNKDKNKKDVGMIIGACLWLPKTLWDELNGFPEWFGSLAEDMFICCSARLLGYPVKALPESGFDHWVGRSLGGGKITQHKLLSTTFRRREKSERNKTYVMIICYPSISLWIALPLHLSILCIEGLILSLIRREKKIWDEIYWYCFKEVWSRKNSLWQTRRKVQQSRCLTLSLFFSQFSVFPHKLRLLFKHGLPKVLD
jgi:GT2 family glycosyltransferase